MKRFSFALLFTVALTSIAQATQVQVWGRDYTYSCGYFSSIEGEYDITLRDDTLPWGTEVTLVTGWSAPGFFEWRERREIPARSVSPFTWRAHVSGTLAYRSGAERRTHLDFVFKVTLPDGTVRWINGGNGSWSFFRVHVLGNTVSNCVGGGKPKPPMTQKNHTVVHRH